MAMITAQDQSYIDSLPQKRDYAKWWYPTQLSPCPLLLRCTKCGDYKLVSDFYTKRDSKKVSRRDILGADHQHACIACHAKSFANQDLRTRLYYSAKSRAKAKGLDFTISIEDIIVPEKCPVLGIRLKSGAGNGTQSVAELETSPTLDRVDNSKGYTPDNICVISLRANNLKRDASLYELRCLAYSMSKPCNDLIVDHSSLMNEITVKATKNADCSASMKDYYKRDHRQKLLTAIRKRGKIYGYDGSITAEDLVIPRYCPALGIELFPSVGKGVKTLDNFYHSPSVDRINSYKGYTKDNVQVISFRANCLKRDASLWEIRALVGYMESFGVVSTEPSLFPNDTTTEPEVAE